jgi:hypothetical protein
MESNWAAEHLQTIRTLMERSALYRRALAPIMLFAGIMGALAAAAGLLLHFDSSRAFGAWWLGTAAVAVGGALLISRRQALRDGEPFWSLPTRRVTQALLPPLTAGFLFSLIVVIFDAAHMRWLFIFPNVLFYGCALHAAGFFMPRGMKLFAWLFIVLGSVILLILPAFFSDPNPALDHLLMGFFFGGLHLAYGAYLYLTEKGKNAA